MNIYVQLGYYVLISYYVYLIILILVPDKIYDPSFV